MKIKTRFLFEPRYFCFGFSWQPICKGKGVVVWLHPLPTLTIELEFYRKVTERERFKNSKI